jgi:hypothetical protein
LTATRATLDVEIEHAFEKARPAHARRCVRVLLARFTGFAPVPGTTAAENFCFLFGGFVSERVGPQVRHAPSDRAWFQRCAQRRSPRAV